MLPLSVETATAATDPNDLTASVADDGRDLTWDAIVAASEHLSRGTGVEVAPVQRDEGRDTLEGFLILQRPITFVVVRSRRRRVGGWREVQPVAAAAAEVGRILRAT